MILFELFKRLTSVGVVPFFEKFTSTSAPGGVLVVQQYAFVAMVPAAVVALLGRRVGMALAFPLAFLFFAVPTGEALVPRLMNWTADFTIGALRLSGIPVYREGNFFSLPTGRWAVVEACSGLRYVIASVTIERMMQMSSMSAAVSGKSSVTSMPACP